MKLAKIEPRYRIPLWSLLACYSFMAMLMVGFVLRHDVAFWQSLPLLGGLAIGSHLANFTISFLLVIGPGIAWIIAGTTSWKVVGGLAAALITANVIYEVFLSIVNTRDIVDALYGVAGVVAGLTVVFLLDRAKTPANSS